MTSTGHGGPPPSPQKPVCAESGGPPRYQTLGQDMGRFSASPGPYNGTSGPPGGQPSFGAGPPIQDHIK